MLFKPVMARVGIKRDKDGIYADRNCRHPGEAAGLSAKARSWRRPIQAPPVPPKGPTSPPTPAAAAAAPPAGDAPWR